MGDVPTPLVAVSQETGATLEKTQQWLKEKITKFGQFPVNSKAVSVSFNSCTLDLAEAYQSNEPKHFVVSLADLDQDSIHVRRSNEGTDVLIFATDKQKKVHFFRHSLFAANFDKFRDDLAISVTDVVVAERIKNAMQHAIAICQERAVQQEQARPKTVSIEPF